MSWKMKQWFRQAMPLLILGLVLYSGYSLYRHGLFRRGLGPAVSSTLGSIPVFGSAFRHFSGRSSYSPPAYAYSPRRSYRGHRFSKRHKRGRHHGRRHNRRHR